MEEKDAESPQYKWAGPSKHPKYNATDKAALDVQAVQMVIFDPPWNFRPDVKSDAVDSGTHQLFDNVGRYCQQRLAQTGSVFVFIPPQKPVCSAAVSKRLGQDDDGNDLQRLLISYMVKWGFRYVKK